MLVAIETLQCILFEMELLDKVDWIWVLVLEILFTFYLGQVEWAGLVDKLWWMLDKSDIMINTRRKWTNLQPHCEAANKIFYMKLKCT